jgi:phosphoribosylformimino-5-aminoimidazole carboxamide ribotide isomerase
MRIIPVLDLKDGWVVHGKAGQRERYAPIVTQFTASAEPIAVAQAIRDRFGFKEFYLADLDAIMGAPPTWSTYAVLRGMGARLWVDAGIRDVHSVAPLQEARIDTIVAGLETLAGPDTLAQILAAVGPKRLVFSLDLRQTKPVAAYATWRELDPVSIAAEAATIGMRRLLVLDLARVGMSGGIGTESLCAQLARSYPNIEISAGGGIRNVEDLHRLSESGVANALVASALHDGRITPEEAAEFR